MTREATAIIRTAVSLGGPRVLKTVATSRALMPRAWVPLAFQCRERRVIVWSHQVERLPVLWDRAL
jgi:hypothetical protein